MKAKVMESDATTHGHDDHIPSLSPGTVAWAVVGGCEVEVHDGDACLRVKRSFHFTSPCRSWFITFLRPPQPCADRPEHKVR